MYKRICLILLLAIVLSLPTTGHASALEFTAGLLYGWSQGSVRHTGVSVIGDARGQVFPGWHVEAGGQISTALSVNGAPLAPFESFTQQIMQFGVSYLVDEETDFDASVGVGLIYWAHQYRDGSGSEGGGQNITSYGPYAKLSVDGRPAERLSLWGEVAYSPWATGGPAGTDTESTNLLRVRGRISYRLLAALSVQGTFVYNNNSHAQWGLSSTWVGGGIQLAF